MRVTPSGKCSEIPKPATNSPAKASTGMVETQNAAKPTNMTAYEVNSRPSAL